MVNSIISFYLTILLIAMTITNAAIVFKYTKRQDYAIIVALFTIAIFGYIFLYLNVILIDALEQFKIYYLAK